MNTFERRAWHSRFMRSAHERSGGPLSAGASSVKPGDLGQELRLKAHEVVRIWRFAGRMADCHGFDGRIMRLMHRQP